MKNKLIWALPILGFILFIYSIFDLNYSFFLISGILFSEFFTISIYQKSIFKEIFLRPKNLLAFVLISLISGFILEFVLHWIGKLWIFPYWNFKFYLISFIPGFAFYWFVLTESYFGFKAIFDYLFKGISVPTKNFRFEGKFFKILGILGILFLVVSFTWFFVDYSLSQKFLFYWSDLNSLTDNYFPPFYIILLFFFGTWFTLEFIEIKRHNSSLIRDVLHNYKSPIISLLLGSLILGILMEVHNTFYYLWIYLHIPLEHIRIFNVEIVVIIAWITQYILFLSLWRAVSSKDFSEEIWKGDLVK